MAMMQLAGCLATLATLLAGVLADGPASCPSLLQRSKAEGSLGPETNVTPVQETVMSDMFAKIDQDGSGELSLKLGRRNLSTFL